MNEPTNFKDRRRRIAKACDSCRQKKLKCDGVRPACSRCMQYDVACMYADVAKPPYRRSSCRIESHSPSLLDTSSAAGIASGAPLSASATSAHGEIPRQSQASREGSAPDDHQDTPSYQGLILGRPDDLRYFGPSTTFSSIFPRTRNKAERHPDAASFGRITASLRGGTFSRWVHPALQPLFGRTVHEPLPTWEQALSLVNDYFHHENRHRPLFDHPTFTAYLGRQYTDDPPPESSWWAALNIVLATAQRRKAGTDLSNWQEALNQAWKYVRNAMSAVLDILFHNISLLSVQALVSIGRFFLDTPNPSRHSYCHPQQARVFWCATILDQLACSKTGRPPAQKAEDYAVRLPEVSEDETLGTCVSVDGKTVLENFRLDAHLSTIEADSFQRLYSAATPARKSPEAQAAVEDLDRQLERWARSIPPAARPGRIHGNNWAESTQPYIYRLHLRYYACLVSIHRARDLEDFWTLRKQTDTTKPAESLGPSIQKCVDAARAMVPLLWKVPQNRCSFYWDLLAFATTALFIIYIYTKRVPSGDRPWQDLEDMRSIVRFMRTQIDHGADSFIHDLQVAAEAACDSSEAAVTHANVITADRSAHDRGSSSLTAHQTAYDDSQDKSMAIDGAASFEAPEPLEGLDSLHQQLLAFPWSFLENDLSFGNDLTGFGF